MAIAYDATTECPEPTRGASSETYSHTCGAGADYLTVTILRNDDTASPAADDVTGVTYNGVSMTQIGKYNTSTQEPGVLYIYGLANPATGSNNVVISLTGSTGSRAYSVTNSYSGVKATQPDASNTGTTTGTSLTVSVTTVADNCWLIGAMGVNAGGVTQSAGTGTVLRGAVTTGDNLGSYDSNSAKTPAGSDSLVMNSSASRTLYGLVLSIEPSVAAAATDDAVFFAHNF